MHDQGSFEDVIKVDEFQGVRVYTFRGFAIERIPAKLVLANSCEPVLEAKKEISPHTTYFLDEEQIPAILAYCEGQQRKQQ